MNLHPNRLNISNNASYLAFVYVSLLFVYVVYRAAHLAFTFDEIVTYDLLKGLSLETVGKSANYHLLNSLLMKGSIALFGDSELALRSPNIMAFVVYVIAAFQIASLLKAYRLQMLILLTAIPFLLDFFSLARGYGLGVGFMLLSVSYLFKFAKDHRFGQSLISLFAAIIAVLANYTLLNYFLPALFILCLIILFHLKKQRILFTAILIVLAGSFLAVLWPILMELKNGGQFYFGGSTDFFSDTICSLGRCFGYFKPLAPVSSFIFISFFFLSIGTAIVFVILLLKNRKPAIIHYLSILFLLTILSPIAQNFLMDTSFPVERTAVMYYPLVILVLFYGINAIPWKQTAWCYNILTGFFLVHFIYTANLTHCYSWRFGSSAKSVITYLKEHHSGSVKLGTDYLHKISSDFYKNREQFVDLSVKEVAGAWEYPLDMEELDPYYYDLEYKCYDGMSYDIKKVISPEVEFYYLDKFFIEAFSNSQIPFEIIQEYPYSRAFLIRMPNQSAVSAN